MIACPVTSQVKGYPLEVALPDGLQTRGVVLANQVRSLDWTQRRLKVIEAVPSQVVEAVLDILMALLEQD